MKKMYLKAVAIILSVILAFTAVPMTAVAQELTETQTATQSNEALIGSNDEIMFDSVEPNEDYVEQNAPIREMTSRREENVKHFIMPDGTVQAIIYSSAVHRKDSNGKWQDIDNSLTLSTVKNKSVYATDDLRTSFSKNYIPNSTLWNLTENGYSISMAFIDDTVSEITPITPELSTNSTVGSESVTVSSINNTTPRNEKILWDTIEEAKLVNNDSSITYFNVRSNTDIEYVLSGNDVKENIIVNAPSSSYVYKFEITLSGLYAILNENGSISIIDAESNEEKYGIPAPYMYDSEYNFSYDVSYALVSSGNGKYIITVTADKDWINNEERVFPVVIDPTIQTSGAADTYIDSQNTGQNYGDLSTLWLSSTRTIFIKMNNYELPSSAELISATLNMSYYYYATVTSGYISAGAYQVTSTWGENTLTWGMANRNANLGISTSLLSAAELSGSAGAYSTSPKWISFDITDAAESWYGNFTLPENNHYGIALKYMMGTNGSVILYSYEASASYRPYFTITYVEDRIPNGVYKIKNVANELYLDVTDGSTSSGTAIQQWEGTSTDNNRNQLFKITYLDTFDNMHHYSIRPMTNSGQGITSQLSGNSVALVTEDISLTEALPDIAFRQAWRISQTENYYTIQNGMGDTGNYITAPSNATNGSAVVTNPTVTNSYGKWILEPYTGEAIHGGSFVDFMRTLLIDETYQFRAIMYSSVSGTNGPIIYSVTEPDNSTTDKAIINSSTGFLTAQKIGTIKVRYTYSGSPWIWSRLVNIGFENHIIHFIRNTAINQYAKINNNTENSPITKDSFLSSDIGMMWKLEYFSDEYFKIKNYQTGYYLCAPENNSDGSIIIQSSFSDPYGLWRFERTTDGYYTIQSKNQYNRDTDSPLYLSISSNYVVQSTADFAKEWEISPYAFNLSLDAYYDRAFDIRYNNASTLITGLTSNVQSVLKRTINLEVLLNSPTQVNSTADNCKIHRGVGVNSTTINSMCPANPSRSPPYCSYYDLNSSEDDTCEDCTSWKQTYRDFIKLHPGTDTTVSAYFIGSQLYDGDGNACNRSYKSSNHGIILQEIHANASLYETKMLPCIIHEISHEIGAPDHYHEEFDDGRCRGGELCNECNPSTGRSEWCIMDSCWRSDPLTCDNDRLYCEGCYNDIILHLANHHIG